MAPLTAVTVADACRAYGVTELVASGGGTRNPVMMRMIGEELPGVRVVPSDRLGLPSAAKEALAFAVLGFLTVHGLPATVPSCTGARRAAVLHAGDDLLADVAALVEIDAVQLVHESLMREGFAERKILAAFRHPERNPVGVVSLSRRRAQVRGLRGDREGAPTKGREPRIIRGNGIDRRRAVAPAGDDHDRVRQLGGRHLRA